MTDLEQKKKAKEFAERWKDKGYEKGESQKYWIDLLENVLDVSNPIDFIEFEDTVHIDKSTGFIDGYIPSTKILIEQKSINKDLRKPIKQSDGSLLNPFQQAKRYIMDLPVSEHPRYVITCNFKSFLVYDMNNPNGEPEEILLKDLGKEYYRLSFIVDSKNEHLKKEEELSFKAGELVGKLYDALSKQYKDLNNEQSQKDLNELCVRLVFCLYAEDAGLFGRRNVFHDYLSKYDDLILMRENLIKLFRTLDTPIDKRDPYLEEELNQFPYVNGGLFSNENIEIPNFTEEIRDILLAKASDDFDWSEISPTIFGAVFESTLNPETRRAGGMHYTSIENIHKVIDPLFLNDLREKLNQAESYKNEKTRNEKLSEFQNYISSLKFLDPACGSGNFLTETYLSLRRLENEAIQVQQGNGIMSINTYDQIKVSIQQFYGIEINDFAVKVAKTALWIAEAQMFQETQKIVYKGENITDFLPLETYENIVEANALRIDWNDVIKSNELNYIMGNPPFVGMKEMTDNNKEDMKLVIKIDKFKQMDYVASWYFKTAEYIRDTHIECAFVSSNSICQGEQALTIWRPLLLDYKLIINFAHRTFIWNSEASIKAHVHCVIVGFSYINKVEKQLFENNKIIKCANINQYLTSGENIFINKIGKPLYNVEKMTKGAQLIDGGNFVIGGEEEYLNIKQNKPELLQYIRRYYNAHDLINGGTPVYVWYLENCPPNVIKNNKIIKHAVEKVYEYRANNNSPTTNILKDIPSKYFQPQVPSGKSIVIPVVSSINRRYIPMCFMPEGMVYTNALFFIDNASIYTFGILTSNVHMAWTRTVCGRLKSDYRYSNTMVYNTFPWPNPTKEQKEKIEKTAQAILDARNLYPNSSLADLYDELAMPKELRKAHQENDKAVMEAYGFNWRKMAESECVAELMKMYKELTEKEQS